MKIVYLAHPVAGDVEKNLAAAKAWLRWCWLTFPDYAFLAPWISCVEVLEPRGARTPEQIERFLRFDEEVVRRCADEVWLVGGRISTGMRREAVAAFTAKKPVFRFGPWPEPPLLKMDGLAGRVQRLEDLDCLA